MEAIMNKKFRTNQIMRSCETVEYGALIPLVVLIIPKIFDTNYWKFKYHVSLDTIWYEINHQIEMLKFYVTIMKYLITSKIIK